MPIGNCSGRTSAGRDGGGGGLLQKEKYPGGGERLPPGGGEVRLLKLDDQHIRSVFDCLRENTTQVRNNALVTIESHYAAQVNHDLYGGETAT